MGENGRSFLQSVYQGTSFMQIILFRVVNPVTAATSLVEMRQFLWNVRDLCRPTESRRARQPQLPASEVLSWGCYETQPFRDLARVPRQSPQG